MTQDLFGSTVLTKNQCEITAENGMLVLKSPYNHGLVSDIKSLPYTDRRWDPARKVWLVAPHHGKWLINRIGIHIGETVKLPAAKTQRSPVIQLLEVHYIGRCKDRNGAQSAFGMLANGAWDMIFPEQTLRDWFEVGDALPGEQSTLYGILGIPKSADDETIKAAYRKMAKTWHPDLNRGDPDAAEQFMRIQDAWEILSSPKMRARYDAGLALEATLAKDTEYQTVDQILGLNTGYRSPLRCGWIMAEGKYQLDRFIVSKILEWQDIVNSLGQVLVVSWPAGAKFPTKVWA